MHVRDRFIGGHVVAVVALGTVLGCHSIQLPDQWVAYREREFYTGCNLHFDREEFNDANYHVGMLLPVGTRVQIVSIEKDAVRFKAEGRTLTLLHAYGQGHEEFLRFLGKIFVEEDPRFRIASFRQPVRDAIYQGRVEQGMTKEQVILSLGYPPAHRTASCSSSVWVYWYNRLFTYQVIFDENGSVANIEGLRKGVRHMIVGPTLGEPVETQ